MVKNKAKIEKAGIPGLPRTIIHNPEGPDHLPIKGAYTYPKLIGGDDNNPSWDDAVKRYEGRED